MMKRQMPLRPAGAIDRQTGSRRVRPLATVLSGLTLLALLGAVLLTWLLYRTLPDPATWSIVSEQQAEPIEGWILKPPIQTSSGAEAEKNRGMLVLFTDMASPHVSDRLLAAALADAHFGIALIPTAVSDDASLPVAEVMRRISTETGLGADRMVVAGQGGSAARLTAALSALAANQYPSGLILISPPDQEPLLATQLALLPDSLRTTIIAGAEPTTSVAARDLFLSASGEDASLFPGLKGTHTLSSEVYLSLDGQNRLVILPALSILNEGWSPRLLQTIQQAILMDPSTAVTGPVPIRTLYHRLLLPIWILLLLAAVPLLWTVMQSARMAVEQRSTDRFAAAADERVNQSDPENEAALADSARVRPAGKRPLTRWLEVALYLPATILAVPLGQLMARIADDGRLAEGYAFYALIGIYGWFTWLLFRFNKPAALENRQNSRPDALSAGRTLLLAFLYVTAVLFWLTTVFGSVLPQGQALRVLPLAAMILLPAMLTACIGYRRQLPQQRFSRSLIHLLMPAAYLAVLVLRQGSAALPGAAWLMGLLIAGRVVAKSLSWDRAPQMLASAAGAWMMLLLLPLPLV